jgi:hypothetical protein
VSLIPPPSQASGNESCSTSSTTHSDTWDAFVRNTHSLRRKYASCDEAQQAIKEILSLLKPVQSRLLALEKYGVDSAGTINTSDTAIDLMCTIDMKIFAVREVRCLVLLCAVQYMPDDRWWLCSKSKS